MDNHPKPSADKGINGDLQPTTVSVNLAEISRLAREHGAETLRRQQIEEALHRLDGEFPDHGEELLLLEHDLLGINQRINSRGEIDNGRHLIGAETNRDITRLETRIRELESSLAQAQTRRVLAKGDETPMAHAAIQVSPQPITQEVQRLDPATVMATPMAPAVLPNRQPVIPAKPHKPWAYTRWVRLGVGFVLVVIVIGAVGLPLLFPISSLAVVNARTVQISSSIPGEVSGLPTVKGSLVTLDQTLGTIVNRTVDASEYNNQREKSSRLMTAAEAIDAEIAKRTAEVEKFRQEFAEHRQRVVNDAKAVMAIENAELDSAREEMAARRRELERLTSMGQGMVAARMLDEARDKCTIAATQVEVHTQRLDRAKARLSAAEQGVFIDQAQPLVLGKLQESETALGTLKGRKDNLAAEVADADRALAAIEKELEAKRRAVVRAPITGYIWSTDVSPGQWVDAAQPLMRVADLSSMTVEVWMPQRHIDSVAINDSAIVRFYGQQDSVIGQVIEKDIPNLAIGDPNLAVQQRPNESKVFRLRISLPQDKLQFPVLGQRVKVLVTGNNPTWFRSMLLRFCTWMEL